MKKEESRFFIGFRERKRKDKKERGTGYNKGVLSGDIDHRWRDEKGRSGGAFV